tara:strand:+ start:554 stop:949 length:396 start_codon:yes stop_codon:yes gene_type:complete
MTQEINLKNSYRIELYQQDNKRKLIQYIQASNTDEAIKKAKRTFEGNLFKLYSRKGLGSVISQKACDLTLLKGKLRFGFNAGWFTKNVEGLTIFQALKDLKTDKRFLEFSENESIQEISAIFNLKTENFEL